MFSEENVKSIIAVVHQNEIEFKTWKLLLHSMHFSAQTQRMLLFGMAKNEQEIEKLFESIIRKYTAKPKKILKIKVVEFIVGFCIIKLFSFAKK